MYVVCISVWLWIVEMLRAGFCFSLLHPRLTSSNQRTSASSCAHIAGKTLQMLWQCATFAASSVRSPQLLNEFIHAHRPTVLAPADISHITHHSHITYPSSPYVSFSEAASSALQRNWRRIVLHPFHLVSLSGRQWHTRWHRHRHGIALLRILGFSRQHRIHSSNY